MRKLTLTTHVATSVGLLGSIAAFLALAVTGLVAEDAQSVRSVYLAMESTARLVIVPLALAALATGVLLSLTTPWGLFRHYWVVAKLALTVFTVVVLLAKIELISHAAALAAQAVLPRAELRAVGIELAVHAAGGLLTLLVPTALSIYKPRGSTPYGRRMQKQQRTPVSHADAPSRQRPVLDAAGSSLRGGSVTIRLGRAQLIGIVAAIVIVHVLVLHVVGAGFGGHG